MTNQKIDLSKPEILIVVKEPGKAPEKRYIPTLELSVMQELVGGHIELFYLPFAEGGQVDLWLNEEGKLNGLEPNLAVTDHLGRIVDVIVGTIFVCQSNEAGESIGLTKDEADRAIIELNMMHLREELAAALKEKLAEMFD